jgi:RNA polymerase sigma-70 factor (ECF subfamily)
MVLEPLSEQVDANSKQLDFLNLLSEARSGSREAIGMLIDHYRPYLLLIANQELDSAVQGKVGASDVVQETMLTAQVALDDFAGSSEDELMAWLRKILLNDLSDAGRKFQRTAKRRVDLEIPIHGDSRIDQPPIELGADTAQPGTNTADAEEAEALYAGLSRLSQEYQVVLRLRNWEQLSFIEIGDQLDRSPDAARKLWSRAVLRLKQELIKLGASDE